MDLRQVFQTVIEKEASDLFLTVNTVPRFRVHGRIESFGDHVISVKEMHMIADSLLEDDEIDLDGDELPESLEDESV